MFTDHALTMKAIGKGLFGFACAARDVFDSVPHGVQHES